MLSTAFFGRESCRFAASPKVGVDAAEGYKYGRLTVPCARRGQEERGAAVTGETSPLFQFPAQSLASGTMSGGRGWRWPPG